MKQYCVYFLTNRSRTLYIGVTNDMYRRMREHKQKLNDGFAKRYNLDQLVYVEATEDVRAAIEREKQLKSWSRGKKLALIESVNPEWEDLSESWFRPDSSLCSE